MEPNWSDVPKQCAALYRAGHKELAIKLRRAANALFDALDSDEVDFDKPLEELTRLKVQGHRLMGWSLSRELEAMYPEATK